MTAKQTRLPAPCPVEALRNALKAFAHHPDETVITNPGIDRSSELPNHYLTMRDLRGLEAWLDNAFELGVKSAGGSIIPDRSKFIELALDRDQIDALAQAAEDVIGDGTFTHTADEALKRFLETISIHRSRK